MLTIKGLSDQRCFVCNSDKETVEVLFADKTFRGVLCLDHIHQKLLQQKKGENGQSSNLSGHEQNSRSN
jgi:hypothetical protein